ncbi:CRISP/Allergen/PR-1-like [Amblyomma americanum]
MAAVVPALQECKEEYRKRRPTHTACKPPNKKCIIKKRRISPEERLLILKTHNDYRSMVALGKLHGFPPAANMARLVWDEELASVAQAKAEQCTSAHGEVNHDDWRDRFTTRFNGTGQNLAVRGRNFPFTSPDWPSRIKEWFIEYEDYPLEQRLEFRVPAHSKPMIGHFTQLVWAKTSYVGCGFVEYSIIGAVKLTHMQLYVCNYAVMGNVFRRPLYQEGPACSACPNGTVCDSAFGLCGIAAGVSRVQLSALRLTAATLPRID